MKKASLVIITLTLILCAFAGGFFLGRGTDQNTIRVSSLPTAAPKEDQNTGISPTEPTPPLLIDINTATEEEFTALPGIGDTLAKRIVAFRAENGPFESLADLLNVEGIGEKKLESILDYITIGGQS